jgi:hypothetical protein
LDDSFSRAFTHLDLHNVVDFPVDIFKDMTNAKGGLRFEHSRVKKMKKGAFNGLERLHELMIFFNNEKSNNEKSSGTAYEDGAFSGLTSLTRLDLQNNAFVEIRPGLFEGLSSLTELILKESSDFGLNVTEETKTFNPSLVFDAVPTLEEFTMNVEGHVMGYRHLDSETHEFQYFDCFLFEEAVAWDQLTGGLRVDTAAPERVAGIYMRTGSEVRKRSCDAAAVTVRGKRSDSVWETLFEGKPPSVCLSAASAPPTLPLTYPNPRAHRTSRLALRGRYWQTRRVRGRGSRGRLRRVLSPGHGREGFRAERARLRRGVRESRRDVLPELRDGSARPRDARVLRERLLRRRAGAEPYARRVRGLPAGHTRQHCRRRVHELRSWESLRGGGRGRMRRVRSRQD